MTVAPPDRPASEPTLSVTRGEFVLIDALAVTVLLSQLRAAPDLAASLLPVVRAARAADEPSDHEHGQQERDDQADAGEHIGENNSGAVLDGHDDRQSRGWAASVHHLLTLEDETLVGIAPAR
jgi:hypothetical protein